MHSAIRNGQRSMAMIYLRWWWRQWYCWAQAQRKKKKKSNKGQKLDGKCKCGSTTHSRTSHKQCPYNKRRLNDAPTPPHIDDDVSPQWPGQIIICHLLVTIYPMKVGVPPMMTGAMNMTLSVVTCVCGALGWAHKQDCPMSSRSIAFLQKCIVQTVVLAIWFCMGSSCQT